MDQLVYDRLLGIFRMMAHQEGLNWKRLFHRVAQQLERENVHPNIVLLAEEVADIVDRIEREAINDGNTSPFGSSS